jgi:hypothetical protein
VGKPGGKLKEFVNMLLPGKIVCPTPPLFSEGFP